MHVGKFLNGYEGFADPDSVVAPGWNQWYSILGSREYSDSDLFVNGSTEHFGHRRTDNVTQIINRDAVHLIDTYAPQPQPFYLQLDERAPHLSGQKDPVGHCKHSALPVARDEGTFTDRSPPHPGSFNEK